MSVWKLYIHFKNKVHIPFKSGASSSITLEFKQKEMGWLKHYNVLPSYNNIQS